MNSSGVWPALVALGYNRPDSLARLLRSLLVADYPLGGSIPLVISLDRADNSLCEDLANAFEWPHGTKAVLVRETRLGLREHVLACGDLTQQHGAIVMLEDDLQVAPCFYQFAVAAIQAYESQPQIAGISLYSHQYNFQVKLPFQPVPNGADAFFLRFPSSWGQAWTARQWSGFRTWLGSAPYKRITADVPTQVVAWPETSWLKLACAYAVETDKTWVYPYHSLSTNCGEPGTNSQRASTVFQVPLVRAARTNWSFPSLGAGLAEYDQYFENCSPTLSQALTGLEWEMDAYGNKPAHPARKRYLVTSREVERPLEGFALRYKPWEVNLLEKAEGADLRLVEASALGSWARPRFSETRTTFAAPLAVSDRTLVRWLLERLLANLKSVFPTRTRSKE